MVISAALLSGCESISYVAQSAGGHLALVSRARSIDDLLADGATTDALRRRLTLAKSLRAFASRELALPDNASYTRYVEVGGPVVAWNVFAAPELSLTAKRWCFPVAGCVAYRGYFQKQKAQDFAGKLRKTGLDVFIGGVPAYSTLGWFADPLPSTVIDYAEADLAALVFHELAHQVVYVKGDTVFNESFATVVELEGTQRWFAARGESQRAQAHAAMRAQAHAAMRARERRLIELILHTRDRLARLYAQDRPAAEKRLAKKKIFAELRGAYTRLKASWAGDDRFDGWLSGELNNARLVAIGAYYELVPAFQRLLENSTGLEDYYAQVRRIGALPVGKRRAALAGYPRP